MTTASRLAQHHVMGLTVTTPPSVLVRFSCWLESSARTNPMARWFQLGGGIVYLVLWIYGLVIDMDGADNWLHLVLGLGMVGLGLWLGRDAMEKTKGRTS